MQKKILVVDDDEGILEAFQIMLESEGYDVKLSSDAEELTSHRNGYKPDLIILDVLLSGKDGREICKQLKSDAQTSKIPVIMMSAHPKVDESVKKSGANDFLPKPFDMDELLQKIDEQLKNN